MQKVYILTGLIASGKSTWAREKVKNSGEDNIIIINRDSIRSGIKGGYFYDETYEDFIKDVVKNMLVEALIRDFDVIIDETNITAAKRKEWIDICKAHAELNDTNIRINIIFFTEMKENVKRRMHENRGISKEVWDDVYNKMLNSFEKPNISELPVGGKLILHD